MKRKTRSKSLQRPKQIISWILALVMTACILPAGLVMHASAEESSGAESMVSETGSALEREGLTFSAEEKNYAEFTDVTVVPETVEVWVKIPEGYSTRGVIVGGYGGYNKEYFWAIEMTAGGNLRWWEEGNNKEMANAYFNGTYSDNAVKINTGEWMLISIVRHQDNETNENEVRAYVNGELAGTTKYVYTNKVDTWQHYGYTVFNYTTGKTTTNKPRLGRDYRSDNNKGAALTFEGQIGELRMWSDDRTPEEIKAGYENDILSDNQQSDAYLSEENLYGAWRLRDLTASEQNPYTFSNLATGTGAAADLGIATVGFPTKDVAADYSATYTNASGVDFEDSTHQLRTEVELPDAPRTISALVNLDADAAGGVIFGNDMFMGSYGYDHFWINLEVNSSGQPLLTLRRNNTSDAKRTQLVADTVDLRGKGWTMVTVVFDDESDVVSWYINGKYVEGNSGVTDTLYVPWQPMKIGGDYSNNRSGNSSTYNNKYFTGDIAYVSVWSSARSQEEILAESTALQADAAAVPTSGDGLMGSWSFVGDGDILKTVYTDKSGNGNDVTPYAELLKDYDSAYLESQNISAEIAEGDYSILIMPDIQNITRDYMGGMSEYLDDYMQWIADNREKYNILGYLNMGDLVQEDKYPDDEGEWVTVQNAIKILEDEGLPGVPMRGNHDRSAQYAKYIDYDLYSNQSWFGGSYEEGYLDNTYWFIEAGERTYLVFSLGWSTHTAAMANEEGYGDPDNAAETKVHNDADLLKWVNEVIDQYPNANVIFTAHNGMKKDAAYNASGEKLYAEVLSKHDNIVLASYGHVHDPNVLRRTDQRSDGVEFSSLLVDAQGIDSYEGTKGLVALLTFKNDSDEVYLNWYSTRDGSLYRVDNQYTFTVPHVESVDLTALEAAVASAKALNTEDYTEKTMADVTEALAEAETVMANKLSVTQTQVDEAAKALNDAIAALPVKKAEEAAERAETAQKAAENAQKAAEAAKADAEKAKEDAETAQAAAEAAQKAAEEAEANAALDAEAAAKAKAAAEEAQTKAEAAQAAAELAQTNAETAQAAAEAAAKAAEESNLEAAREAEAVAASAANAAAQATASATSAADSAKAAADAAKSAVDAEEAKKAAEEAQAKAEAAQKAAEEAAEKASADAEQDAEAAETAKTEAEAAQAEAETAKTEAEAAQAEAEKAKAEAEAAQAEAEKAKAEAEAAKAAAEKAQANAANDQSAANAARAAAEEAQRRAEEAQAKAEAAVAEARVTQAKAEAAQQANEQTSQQANQTLADAEKVLSEMEAAAERVQRDKETVEEMLKAAETAAELAKAEREAAESLKAEAEAALKAAEAKAEEVQANAEMVSRNNGIHWLCLLMASLFSVAISIGVNLALNKKKSKK